MRKVKGLKFLKRGAYIITLNMNRECHKNEDLYFRINEQKSI